MGKGEGRWCEGWGDGEDGKGRNKGALDRHYRGVGTGAVGAAKTAPIFWLKHSHLECLHAAKHALYAMARKK